MGMQHKNSRRRKRDATMLTETELEIMTLLWEAREGSVRDLIGMLPEQRQLAYTTVSTMLRILEEKAVVGSRKQGRGHIYFPLIPKREYERKSVRRLVEGVFAGTPLAMVRSLLETDQLSERELQEIRRMLDERLEKDG